MLSYWVSYCAVALAISGHNVASVNIGLGLSQFRSTFLGIFLFISFIVFFFWSLKIIAVSLFLTFICFWILHATNSASSLKECEPEFISLTLFICASSVINITSPNATLLVFSMELLGSTALYSFFVYSTIKYPTSSNSSIWAISSSIYQLVLNFFGSFFLYVSMYLCLLKSGTSTFMSSILISSEGASKFVLHSFVYLLLVKIGTGPWVFFKANIYKGLRFSPAILYTITYLASGLVTFFFLSHGILNKSVYSVILYCMLSSGLLGLLSNIFQSSNIIVFLSLSSFLNVFLMVITVI